MICGADEQKAGLRGDNEAAAGLLKIADDPSLTRVGRVLRRRSLDGLRQLVNLLRDEMSSSARARSSATRTSRSSAWTAAACSSRRA